MFFCIFAGTCLLWPRRRVYLRWTFTPHCPRRCLPFRSPHPTPAMPSPCRPPPRPSPWQPTHPTTTSPSCTATGDPDARITRRRARAPFRPALTASWTMRITRPHRSTCPPESSRRRAAAATIGTGGRGSTATCRSARRTPGTTALKAACQTASGRTMRSATSAMARARRFSVCRTWTPPNRPPSTDPTTRGLSPTRDARAPEETCRPTNYLSHGPDRTMHPFKKERREQGRTNLHRREKQMICYRPEPMRNIFYFI